MRLFSRRVESPVRSALPDAAAGLTLLDRSASRNATAWLRQALTHFATPVSAFVPGQLPAYARIYNPFDSRGDLTAEDLVARRWNVLAGREMESAHEAAEFALRGPSGMQAPVGSLSRVVVDRLIGPLTVATTTPDACYFALWEGFGDSIVPSKVRPTLELPHRRYHVFAGSIDAARTSYSSIPFGYRSANLWWPEDHAWCVSTEVDFAWTYVAGPRSCIDTLLSHAELDARETTADAPW